jgi:glycosyltransferase involved in cell wall biosynthesis
VPFTHAVARARGLPIVGLPLFHLERPSASWPRQRWLSRSTTALVALTPPEAAHAQRLGARNVQVIAPGIRTDWAAQADGLSWRAARGIAADRPIVLFVGRQVRHKGAPLLVAAMQHVWHDCPEALLVFAGRSRNRDAETTAAMEQLGQNERDRVLLVDDFSDEEAPSLLQSCSVLVMPSIQDSFGLVYLQAWSAGRPVIGADVPSTQSIVTHGENGLLVPPNDKAALATAILSCVRNPHYATKLGLAGQHRANSVYTLKAQHDGWRMLLERIPLTERQT